MTFRYWKVEITDSGFEHIRGNEIGFIIPYWKKFFSSSNNFSLNWKTTIPFKVKVVFLGKDVNIKYIDVQKR